MQDDGTASGREADQAPEEAGMEQANLPEAAPTDFRKHRLLLCLMLSVIVLAWLAGKLTRRDDHGDAEKKQAQTTGRTTSPPRQGPGGR